MRTRIAEYSFFLIFSIILTLPGPAHAASHFVKADATGDYATIQDAITASAPGDTLLLAHGVFSGPGNWDIDFGGKDLVLKPADSVSSVTIDCLGGASGAHRAFYFHSGETPAAIVEHITITNGYLLDENGGGILISGSSPTIRNCIVRFCEVVDTGLPGLAYGGGICVQNGSPVLDKIVISTNTAGTYGGGIFCSGSGSPLVSRCSIQNNLCDYGAGIFISSSSISIVGCTFNWNGQAGTTGGGVYVSGVPAAGVTSIANCIFYTNYATTGSGIFASTSDPHVANCNFINNDPWVFQGDGGTVTDCIFSNGGSEIDAPGATVSYCWIEGGHPGTGNITGVTLNNVMGLSGQYNFPAGHEIENAGSDLASNICFQNAAGTFCMDERTLLTFNQYDTGQVDIGYHYVRVPAIFDIPGTFSTIQAAIDNAIEGDRIRLTSEVTYHENIDFTGKNITVYGYVPSLPGIVAHIEGDGTGPVVTIDSGETSSAELKNLRISGGDAQHGGGILIRDSSPTLRNCSVYSNTATYGGGIYCNNSSAELIDVFVHDNEAAIGGGIVVTYADITIDDSHIYRNISTGAGAGGVGGGVYCNYGSLSITDTEIYGNTAQEYSGASRGGAFYRTGFAVLPTVLSNCTLYNNTAITGSGIAANDVGITVNNTIIGWGNVGEAVSCEGTATATLTCCDVYNNEGGDWTGGIDGQGEANGNISTDPIFNDAANDDLAIARISPCAMEFSDGCGNIGASWEGTMPQTVTVNPDGSGFQPTIQDAIDTAKGGWKIILANGTFSGAGNRDITFNSKSIELCAMDGSPDSCLIDCEGSDIDPHRGILLNGREGNFTRIEGITIRNAFTDGGGGGMHINQSHPTVENCTFLGCIAFDGAGIQTYKSEAVITGCLFRLCYATDAGGGIMNHTSAPVIRDCTFIDNFGEWGGGGVYNHYSAPAIEGCVFSGNSSDHWGGALHNNHPESSPVLRNCTFSESRAPLGGHIYSRNNAAPVIYNSILAFSFEGAAAYAATGATTTLSCCDVYLNTGGDYVEALAGQDGIDGNFSADPEFCNQTSHNYRLIETSPCAQANSGDCGLIGALWHGCNPTSGVEETGPLPTANRLHNSFPNPFNPKTSIAFDLANEQAVSLRIYDVSGRLVDVLLDGDIAAQGHNEVVWRGRDSRGRIVSAGVYFYRLEAGSFSETKRMTLIK